MKRFLIAGTFRARCRGQVLAADAPMPGTSRLPPVYGGADRQLTDLYIGVDGGGAFCDSNWIDRSNAPRAISSAVGRYSAAPSRPTIRPGGGCSTSKVAGTGPTSLRLGEIADRLRSNFPCY
jgi:hypothetical protein